MDNNKRPQTFDDALKAINEAMLAQGASLKELLNSDYANIRTAVEDLAPRVAQQFKATTGPYVDKARPVVSELDRQFKKNPYLVIGGIALGAAALGYFFGRSKTPPPAMDYTGLSYGDAPLTTNNSDNVELA